MCTPAVAIVGRPNVGKSTLFNRLLKERKSLVEDLPGVTRDRIYGECSWNGTLFSLIDTGGLDTASEEAMRQSIASQVRMAMGESDVILILCDVKDGLLPEDRELVNYVRTIAKPFVVAVNKVDGPKTELAAAEFFELGEGALYFISASHGLGVGDLLDDLVRLLPISKKEPLPSSQHEGVRITFLGRPNAGKSSLINRIIDKTRLLVDDVAGTTVDAVEIPFERDGHPFVLVDTAGMRRKRSIKHDLEKLAIFRAVRALERSDIVVLMLDAELGIHEQDAKLASLINTRGRGLVVAFNKWDKVKGTSREQEIYEEWEHKLRFVQWARTVRTSAKTGKGIKRLFEELWTVHGQWSHRVPTGRLNRFLEEILTTHPPPFVGRKPLRFYFITQASVQPPTFIVSTNRPEKIPKSYKRYLLNRLREELEFTATPIKLFFRPAHDGDEKP